MTFGESAQNYHQARDPYPSEVFRSIVSQATLAPDQTLLDLGCGTGIATVGLQKLSSFKIIGCDSDQEMINEALKNSPSSIKYTTANASKMQFHDNTFDVVTTFGAFHWFCDADSIREVKRILKPRGLFFVVNKNDNSEFRNEIMNIAKQHIELRQAFQKENYYPNEILTNNGFDNVSEEGFQVVEKYNLSQLISLIKSMQFWSHVPPKSQYSLVEALQDYFTKKLCNDYYERFITVNVVKGLSPQNS